VRFSPSVGVVLARCKIEDSPYGDIGINFTYSRELGGPYVFGAAAYNGHLCPRMH
jgi:hypothetical protein